MLAQAELEAKLAQELADLRDVMGVIPKYPFDEQAVTSLNTRLYLNPVDDERVHVVSGRNPRIEYWASVDYQSVGLMTHAETLNWMRKRLEDPNNLPVRVDILWKNEAGPVLRDKVIRTIRDLDAQMQADVRLGRNPFIGSGEAPYYLRNGTITTFYPASVRQPGGAPGELLVNGPVDLDKLEEHIRWRMTMQSNLPVTFRIEYDRASIDLARRLTEEIERIAKRLGVTELVDIESIFVNPVPQEAFMGRWQAVTAGEVQSIDIDPGGKCHVRIGERSPLGSPGEVVTCQWYLTSREIVADPKKTYSGGRRYVFRAHIDEDGNLAACCGLFYPQGSFHLSSLHPTILREVN